MGGLNATLNIGVQALDAAQGALDATSNNIANVNTPGYTEEVRATQRKPAETCRRVSITGGGVTLDGIQSVQDELLNLQIQQQTSSAEQRQHGVRKSPTDSDLLHDDRNGYCQRADQLLQQPGGAVGELRQHSDAAKRPLVGPGSCPGLQYHGEWFDERTIVGGQPGHVIGSADQYTDRSRSRS